MLLVPEGDASRRRHAHSECVAAARRRRASPRPTNGARRSPRRRRPAGGDADATDRLAAAPASERRFRGLAGFPPVTEPASRNGGGDPGRPERPPRLKQIGVGTADQFIERVACVHVGETEGDRTVLTEATSSSARWRTPVASLVRREATPSERGGHVVPVGVRGFEPRASCPPDKRANQAAPHPEVRSHRIRASSPGWGRPARAGRLTAAALGCGEETRPAGPPRPQAITPRPRPAFIDCDGGWRD